MILTKLWHWRWTALILTVTFWVVYAGALRATVATPEACEPPTIETMENNVLAARDWIVRNQKADGSYSYQYGLTRRVNSTEYNDVRHAGVTLALYEVAGHFKDQDTLTAGDLGLVWMLQRTVQKGDNEWSALTPDGERLKLGSTALMTAALAERRLITGDQRFDELMRSLGRFMLSLQREDGGFHIAYVVDNDAPDSEGTSAYYAGEALWAYTLLNDAFPEEGWDEASHHAATYIATIRDKLENVDGIPDHWMAYGLGEMADWELTDPERDYARKLADRFGPTVRLQGRMENSPLGEKYNGPPSRAASLGTRVEGLTALWRLASVDPQFANEKQDIYDTMVCGASILSQRQYTAEQAQRYSNPSLVEGAWFEGGVTRMDDQQHAISALLYTIDAMKGSTERGADLVGEEPPAEEPAP